MAIQIDESLADYTRYTTLRHTVIFGGVKQKSQTDELRAGTDILTATPGRLLDLMERKTVSLTTIQNVVMDEADEMLNMGFTDSINAILADVPQERNTLLFSATMSLEIARISKKYLRDAKEITIGRKNESTSNVKHVAYTVHAKDKYEALKRIVDYYPQIYGIIFCRTRKETQEIADKLMHAHAHGTVDKGLNLQRLLSKVCDRVDVGAFETVEGTYGEVEVFDRHVDDRIRNHRRGDDAVFRDSDVLHVAVQPRGGLGLLVHRPERILFKIHHHLLSSLSRPWESGQVLYPPAMVRPADREPYRKGTNHERSQ